MYASRRTSENVTMASAFRETVLELRQRYVLFILADIPEEFVSTVTTSVRVENRHEGTCKRHVDALPVCAISHLCCWIVGRCCCHSGCSVSSLVLPRRDSRFWRTRESVRDRHRTTPPDAEKCRCMCCCLWTRSPAEQTQPSSDTQYTTHNISDGQK